MSEARKMADNRLRPERLYLLGLKLVGEAVDDANVRTGTSKATELGGPTMPKQDHYEGMTLPEALREFAKHHLERSTRHISDDEAQLIDRAAAALERECPGVLAFP